MTGYGSSSLAIEGKQYTLEIRTLNSKQLEMNMRLPVPYKSLEMDFRKIITKILQRGKVDLFFILEMQSVASNSFNIPLMKNYAKELKAFCESEDLPQNEILRTISMLPDVMSAETKIEKDIAEQLFGLCRETCAKALDYRLKEGEVLEKDFITNIKEIENRQEKIKDLLPHRTPRIKERLLQSLTLRNTKDLQYDNNRLEQEMIYYLEKLDVNEEMVRLANNCDLFSKELENDHVKKGKKLAFITQEIGREINTIGSKANDKDIQVLVVEMKDHLEKIKEQLLNVL